jgi:hypothetical protein
VLWQFCAILVWPFVWIVLIIEHAALRLSRALLRAYRARNFAHLDFRGRARAIGASCSALFRATTARLILLASRPDSTFQNVGFDLIDAPPAAINELGEDADGELDLVDADSRTLAGNWWRHLIALLRSEFNTQPDADSYAQRQCVRYRAFKLCSERGIRPSHIAAHLDKVVELVFTPTIQQLDARRFASSVSVARRVRDWGESFDDAPVALRILRNICRLGRSLIDQPQRPRPSGVAGS